MKAKMMTKKLMKKSFLTAAICLALSGSALAMPTGGEVVHGNIDGIVDGAITSGTVNVNTTAIINWNDFSIANGETLNFTINDNAVLNRVVGNELSSLLGTLNVEGPGAFLLVNPNGITIGDGADINVPNLTLSTLALDNDDFLRNISNNQDAIAWTTPEGRSVPASIDLKDAALTVGLVDLYGGKVTLDNVTISNTDAGNTSAEFLRAYAVKKAGKGSFEAGAENEILVKENFTIEAGEGADATPGATLYAGKVTFDGAMLDIPGKLSVDVLNKKADGNAQATKENAFVAKNSIVESDEFRVMAGSAELTGTEIDAPVETDIDLLTNLTETAGEDDAPLGRVEGANADSSLVMKGGSIKSGAIKVDAGKISLEDHAVLTTTHEGSGQVFLSARSMMNNADGARNYKLGMNDESTIQLNDAEIKYAGADDSTEGGSLVAVGGIVDLGSSKVTMKKASFAANDEVNVDKDVSLYTIETPETENTPFHKVHKGTATLPQDTTFQTTAEEGNMPADPGNQEEPSNPEQPGNSQSEPSHPSTPSQPSEPP